MELEAADEAGVFRAGCRSLAAALGCEVVVLHRRSANSGERVGLAMVDAQPPGLQLAENDLAAADWVAGHGQPAGRSTQTLAGSTWSRLRGCAALRSFMSPRNVHRRLL